MQAFFLFKNSGKGKYDLPLRNGLNLQGDDQGCGSWIWLKLEEVLLYDK